MISNLKYREYLINNSQEYLKNNNLYCLTQKEINVKKLDNFSDLKKNFFNYLKNILYTPLKIIFEKQ